MDTIWIIILIVAVVIVLSLVLSIATFSSDRFYQQYEKYNEVAADTELNILDFIHNLNNSKFKGRLNVVQVERDTENFYIPRTKTVGLSTKTLTSNSISSFAIVAHEMGHALQDAQGNKLTLLNILRRIGSFVGFLFLPSLIAAVVLLLVGEDFFTLSMILFSVSAGIFLLAILIKAITISIEKDASNNGIKFLEEILDKRDVSSCKKLLNSARLTYWGDLFKLMFSWTLLTKKTTMFRS